MIPLFYIIHECLEHYVPTSPSVRVIITTISIGFIGILISQSKNLYQAGYLEPLLSPMRRKFKPTYVVEVHSYLRGVYLRNQAFYQLEKYITDASIKGQAEFHHKCVQITSIFSNSDSRPLTQMPLLRETFNLVYQNHKIKVTLHEKWIDRGRDRDVVYYYRLTNETDKNIIWNLLEFIQRHDFLINRGVQNIHLWKNDEDNKEKKIWSPVPFKSGRVFSSIFLKDRQEISLEEDLNQFLNSESRYKSLGASWNRGYLLHGPAGTGKSSTIKAFIETAKWHTYWINMSNYQNSEELSASLISIPEHAILLFEEIDTQEVSRYDTKSKKADDNKKSGTPTNPNSLDVIQSTLIKHLDDTKNNAKDKLGLLLNLLDGLLAGHGRIIIMTTNHLDRLDAALIRPGRIDVKIHMDYIDFDQCKRMLEFYYPEQFIPTKIFEHIQEWNVSPAKVSGICLQHLDSLDNALNSLKELSTLPDEQRK